LRNSTDPYSKDILHGNNHQDWSNIAMNTASSY
jgi:hypothetical protein